MPLGLNHVSQAETASSLRLELDRRLAERCLGGRLCFLIKPFLWRWGTRCVAAMLKFKRRATPGAQISSV